MPKARKRKEGHMAMSPEEHQELAKALAPILAPMLETSLQAKFAPILGQTIAEATDPITKRLASVEKAAKPLDSEEAALEKRKKRLDEKHERDVRRVEKRKADKEMSSSLSKNGVRISKLLAQRMEDADDETDTSDLVDMVRAARLAHSSRLAQVDGAAIATVAASGVTVGCIVGGTAAMAGAKAVAVAAAAGVGFVFGGALAAVVAFDNL